MGTFETAGRDVTATDGESVLGRPDTERGESGTVRVVTRLSTYKRHQQASHTRSDHFTGTTWVDGPTYLSLQRLLRRLKGLELSEDLVEDGVGHRGL